MFGLGVAATSWGATITVCLDGSCDFDSCAGCQIVEACNYDAEATLSADCEFPAEGYDCDGNCLIDSDMDGVCDAFEVEGCGDEAALNFDEDATENDVQELCRNFGSVRRVYIATDKRTGLPRGFAFVDFHNKTDALKAIETLNGYGYDNLILSVSMAEPSKPREGDAASRPLIRSVAAS